LKDNTYLYIYIKIEKIIIKSRQKLIKITVYLARHFNDLGDLARSSKVIAVLERYMARSFSIWSDIKYFKIDYYYYIIT
jgi:hypothetical protein